MDEVRETFNWMSLKDNFIKHLSLSPREECLQEVVQELQQFIKAMKPLVDVVDTTIEPILYCNITMTT